MGGLDEEAVCGVRRLSTGATAGKRTTDGQRTDTGGADNALASTPTISP